MYYIKYNNIGSCHKSIIFWKWS